jgi:hypothetical protein
MDTPGAQRAVDWAAGLGTESTASPSPADAGRLPLAAEAELTAPPALEVESTPPGAVALAPRLRSLVVDHESRSTFLLIAVISWIAQFHHFRDFGLYEDDYWFISEAMGKDPSYLATRFVKAFTTLPQGRPFGFFVPDLLSWVGDRLGGLPAIYLVGFLVVVLNSFLFARLLRRRVPPVVAAIGGVAFCLFPADTTKFLLIHDFQLQPSLTFVLLASLAYARGWLPLAYVAGAGSLLAYENGFLPFFALPLLVRRWDRQIWRELARHVLILIVVLAAIVALRYVVGEGRATSSVGSMGEVLPKLVGSMVIGPSRALAAYLYGPLRAVAGWDAETVLLAVGSAIGLATLARVVPRPRTPEWRDLLQVAAAGAVMLVVAYALAFTHYPPTAVVGRGTSLHLGATVGASVLFACGAWALFRFAPKLAPVLLSAYLALAVGYQLTIARDFIRAWQLQRGFWQDVAACCSDLQDSTVLLYELDPAGPETTFIFPNSWADALVLDETYGFPSSWANSPRLFSLTDWRARVEPEGDHLRWWVPAASWDEHWERLPDANVILLRRGQDGGLERLTGTVDVGGRQLVLKAPGPAGQFPPAQLYHLLLDK